ncbi:LOW QUALITY PROTEIN: hypothetical protein MAR_032171 [Mya arenaria]|uniref:Uncharacterized protein n=1 Tax=Mya arenaria TaxID=6604 RepID=A0ABY7F977_MYAAR|nr:LOW QUALITY PROTEIN: hypothetical protein MAR_032171 [Mya arenaria]
MTCSQLDVSVVPSTMIMKNVLFSMSLATFCRIWSSMTCKISCGMVKEVALFVIVTPKHKSLPVQITYAIENELTPVLCHGDCIAPRLISVADFLKNHFKWRVMDRACVNIKTRVSREDTLPIIFIQSNKATTRLEDSPLPVSTSFATKKASTEKLNMDILFVPGRRVWLIRRHELITKRTTQQFVFAYAIRRQTSTSLLLINQTCGKFQNFSNEQEREVFEGMGSGASRQISHLLLVVNSVQS